MLRIASAILLTLFIMHLGAFVAYGSASAFFDLQPPSGVSAGQLFLSVFLQKLGLAVAFVLLYRLALNAWRERWFLYSVIWFAMFTIMEIGQAIGPAYSLAEAIAGIGAEAIYCPLSAFCLHRLFRSAGDGAT